MRILILLLIISSITISCNNEKGQSSLIIENIKGKVKRVKEYCIYKNQDDSLKANLKTLRKITNYNELGLYKEQISFENGVPYEIVIYHYNANNLITSFKTYFGDGRLKSQNYFNYINEDSIVEIKYLSPIGKEISEGKYRVVNRNILNDINDNKYVDGKKSYDNKGKLLEWIFYEKPNILKGKYQYKYDNNGNLIECIYFDSLNNWEYKDVCKYDNNLNLIEEKGLNLNNEIENLKEYKYDYDKKGNWIKKALYHNNELCKIEEREIEYY